MTADDLNVSDQWREWRRRVDLDEYSDRFDRMAADGANVHGEAEFVASLGGRNVLDAGCGTGRVAIELHRRGLLSVGIDNDEDMLAIAKVKQSAITWVLGDLGAVDLGQRFDVAVMAGNVLNFVTKGSEAMVVANLANHLRTGGLLVSGASITHPDQLAEYDEWCNRAGLVAAHRYASWDRALFGPAATYAVSVHRLAVGNATEP